MRIRMMMMMMMKMKMMRMRMMMRLLLLLLLMMMMISNRWSRGTPGSSRMLMSNRRRSLWPRTAVRDGDACRGLSP